jgi:hypothetical protein
MKSLKRRGAARRLRPAGFLLGALIGACVVVAFFGLMS